MNRLPEIKAFLARALGSYKDHEMTIGDIEKIAAQWDKEVKDAYDEGRHDGREEGYAQGYELGYTTAVEQAGFKIVEGQVSDLVVSDTPN